MLKASLSVWQILTEIVMCLEITGNKQLHLEAGNLKINRKSACQNHQWKILPPTRKHKIAPPPPTTHPLERT